MATQGEMTLKSNYTKITETLSITLFSGTKTCSKQKDRITVVNALSRTSGVGSLSGNMSLHFGKCRNSRTQSQ